MSRETRMIAGVLLLLLPTVMYGGLSILALLTQRSPGFFVQKVARSLSD